MHKEQQDFCDRLKGRFRHLFEGRSVLDCGSLDVNGNNRYLFSGGSYWGIDLVDGPNVDQVCLIHEFIGGPFDVVISTEVLEHDKHLQGSMARMIDLLKTDGMLVITCATIGRQEHGTKSCLPYASPGTIDYYRNVTPAELAEPLSKSFHCWSVEVHHGDLYAWATHKKNLTG